MSEQDEFEKWINKTYPGRFCYHHKAAANHMLKGWRACEELNKAIIDKQAQEIEVLRKDFEQKSLRFIETAKENASLRGFAESIVEHCGNLGWIEQKAKKFKLIDESGNPTELLTGDKNG